METEVRERTLMGTFWTLAAALLAGVVTAAFAIYAAEQANMMVAPSAIGLVAGSAAGWLAYHALWNRR
jgi:hypothetical protein